jgi:hypothetical protein
MRKDCAVSRRQAAVNIRVESFDWKSRISETLQEMNIITDTFTGEITISFKEGGICRLERKEIFK